VEIRKIHERLVRDTFPETDWFPGVPEFQQWGIFDVSYSCRYGRLFATAGIVVFRHHVELGRLAIHTEYRGRGYAQPLLEVRLQHILDNSFPNLYYTFLRPPHGPELYLNFGFELVNHTDGDGDVILYAKKEMIHFPERREDG